MGLHFTSLTFFSLLFSRSGFWTIFRPDRRRSQLRRGKISQVLTVFLAFTFQMQRRFRITYLHFVLCTLQETKKNTKSKLLSFFPAFINLKVYLHFTKSNPLPGRRRRRIEIVFYVCLEYVEKREAFYDSRSSFFFILKATTGEWIEKRACTELSWVMIETGKPTNGIQHRPLRRFMAGSQIFTKESFVLISSNAVRITNQARNPPSTTNAMLYIFCSPPKEMWNRKPTRKIETKKSRLSVCA